MNWKDRIKGLPETVKILIRVLIYCILFSLMFFILRYYDASVLMSGIGALGYILFYWWNRYMDKVDVRIKESSK